ncbi:hypothetical protein BGX28_002807, partial [Mortierella sp. GBA30]
MPLNTPSTRKTPLVDITHRPLGGRRSGNTSSQLVSNPAQCSAASGEENSPVRGLLEIFAAAQAGSLGRKRSLKLTGDDHDTHNLTPAPPSPTARNASQTSTGAAVAFKGDTITFPTSANIPTESSFSLSYNSTRPLNFISTLSRRATFGCFRNRPCYVSTRFYMLKYINRPSDVYTFVSQDETTLVPPFSCAYNNVANEARNLAVGDEDGTIHIVDTRQEGSHPERTQQILAHQNAIFDVCWTTDDTKIISVSGDQTAKLHDVETKKCIGIFSGHSGSIKSVSLKHGDDSETLYRPADKLLNVHASTTRSVPPKKSKHGSDGPNTASAVQYMKHNENIIASTGTLDGSIKYWDVRKHGSYFKHDYPTPLQTSSYTPVTKRSHGMTSMALSPDGSALYAVSSDNHIYKYNTTSLCSPVESFGGSDFTCSSYYIKISVSPDGNYIAAGSSKDLYVWEVNRPDTKPLIFHGHESEVTGVDWAKDLGNGTE